MRAPLQRYQASQRQPVGTAKNVIRLEAVSTPDEVDHRHLAQFISLAAKESARPVTLWVRGARTPVNFGDLESGLGQYREREDNSSGCNPQRLSCHQA
jgi:hypothetical protein